MPIGQKGLGTSMDRAAHQYAVGPSVELFIVLYYVYCIMFIILYLLLFIVFSCLRYSTLLYLVHVK